MRTRLVGIAILGVSLILSAVVFGIFFYQSRMPVKTIKVVGAATKRIDSDIVKWRVTIARNTGLDSTKEGYARIKTDLEAFLEMLRANGIDKKDITVQPVNTNQIYKNGDVVGYTVMQSVYLVSNDIPKVEAMALDPSFLAEKGILLQSSSLEYYQSKLSAIKKELLAEATKDARGRAAEIAKSSGDTIKNIASARVGVFQITEPYSTEVSDYGIYNTATKEKDITVTVNVEFSLK